MTEPIQPFEAFDPDKLGREVHLIGLGGIGSWILVLLMKMGVPVIHIYDDDRISSHNIRSQVYRKSDVGTFKVDAMVAYAQREELEATLIPHRTRIEWDSDIQFDGIVISGVDSMVSRKAIWCLIKYNGLVELYMDGRIGGEWFHLYTLNPCDPEQITRYSPWLFDDEEGSSLPCAVRSDLHAAIVLNGFVTYNLALFAQGKPVHEILHGNLSAVAVNGQQTSVVRSI